MSASAPLIIRSEAEAWATISNAGSQWLPQMQFASHAIAINTKSTTTSAPSASNALPKAVNTKWQPLFISPPCGLPLRGTA